MATRRTSRGRQRIEMVKMKNESSLQVTFSKRRFGLFKKASELVTLCGAEICLIVFSPGHKVFTFGNPNVETVIEKYLAGHSYQSGHSNPDRVAEAHRMVLDLDLNNELADKESLKEGEKRIGNFMDRRLENYPLYERWGRPSADDLSLEELEEFKAALEGLKKEVGERMTQLIFQNNANTNPFTLDHSGLFERNLAPYSGFVGREGDSNTSMIHQNLGASGAGSSSSSMSLGFDLGFGF